MIKSILLVGIGGSAGCIARYLTALYITKVFPVVFPMGTFVANILGCLIIGLIFGLSEKHQWASPEFRLLLATGFCGGYTTFSSFSYENIKLLMESNYLTFALYSISSFALGLLAVVVGLVLIKIF